MSSSEDTAAIEARLVRYCAGIDRRDWESFRTLFTPNCTIDYGSIGQWSTADEITDFMDRTHAPMGHTLHRLTNCVVDVAEDSTEPRSATSRSYVDVLLTSADGTSGSNAAGFYDDLWVLSDAGWQIAARTFTLVRLNTFENQPLPTRS
jgi:3-phenylpropionate/cinnamic acid dioxygenase small subunit